MRTRVIFALGSAASRRGGRTSPAAGTTASDLRNALRFIESLPFSPQVYPEPTWVSRKDAKQPGTVHSNPEFHSHLADFDSSCRLAIFPLPPPWGKRTQPPTRHDLQPFHKRVRS